MLRTRHSSIYRKRIGGFRLHKKSSKQAGGNISDMIFGSSYVPVNHPVVASGNSSSAQHLANVSFGNSNVSSDPSVQSAGIYGTNIRTPMI
jgi:hypothetical protein